MMQIRTTLSTIMTVGMMTIVLDAATMKGLGVVVEGWAMQQEEAPEAGGSRICLIGD